MNNEIKASQGAESQAETAEISQGRRRLLRGSLGSVPVLATFVSQPVHATYSCKSASAYTSANASRPGVAQCSGCSPTWWKTNTTSWVGCNTAARFDTYFSATPRYPAGVTLLAVLNGPPSLPDTSVDQLARSMVAALLNIKSGRIGAGVFDEPTLKIIWTGAIGTGYVPSAGSPAWNAAATNTWLGTVFPTT